MANFDTSPQLALVKKWLDAYLSLDVKNVEPLISQNFQYEAFPEATDIPEEAKEKHIEKYREILAAGSKFEATYHEVIEAPGKVVVHLTGLMTTVFGVALPYETVAIITLVEEDGELKVLHSKDFADPQMRNDFIAGAVKAAAQRAAA